MIRHAGAVRSLLPCAAVMPTYDRTRDYLTEVPATQPWKISWQARRASCTLYPQVRRRTSTLGAMGSRVTRTLAQLDVSDRHSPISSAASERDSRPKSSAPQTGTHEVL